MGSSLHPALPKIYMGWLERRGFDDDMDKPKLWVRYFPDTFVVWQHGKLTFFKYLNN